MQTDGFIWCHFGNQTDAFIPSHSEHKTSQIGLLPQQIHIKLIKSRFMNKISITIKYFQILQNRRPLLENKKRATYRLMPVTLKLYQSKKICHYKQNS